ncbi:unnamed protein product [Prunus armeniaca]
MDLDCQDNLPTEISGWNLFDLMGFEADWKRIGILEKHCHYHHLHHSFGRLGSLSAWLILLIMSCIFLLLGGKNEMYRRWKASEEH